MGPDRNKLVFLGVLLCITAFIVLYALSMGGEEDGPGGVLEHPRLPALGEEVSEFPSKLEALEAIKEQRETPKPSLYGEALIDSMGRFDPLLEEKRREQIVDSIYRLGRIDYGKGEYRAPQMDSPPKTDLPGTISKPTSKPKPQRIDLGLAHLEFFRGVKKDIELRGTFEILAMVHGAQRVGANGRLELRLGEDLVLGDTLFKRNSLLYGFVSLKANRVLVSIDHIAQHPVSLRAFDLADGGEGIYVEHSYREEAGREVLDDAVQEINIAGLPPLGGVKKVLRRSNRRIRVSIRDGYRLYLKP